MTSPRRLARQVYRRLLKLYGLPEWRHPLSPLDELVSTILSQNTNDANRDRAFSALRGRFPTWEAARDAPPGKVVDAISLAGLGNQKGARIQAILKAITAERGKLDLEFLRELPPADARSWLMGFKGVGPKTAAIVQLFSLGQPTFPVDTHIYRVSGRLGLRPAAMGPEAAHKHLAGLFPPETYAAAHLNLIRHGREVCHARHPACDRCVLLDLCEYPRRTQMPLQTAAAND